MSSTVEHVLNCRYYTDPSGTFWQCNAKAIGSGSEGADSSLQEQYNKVSISIEDFLGIINFHNLLGLQ